MTITVNGIEYKIKFGFRALAKANVLQEVMAVQKIIADNDKKAKEREEERKQRETFHEHFKNEVEDDTEETTENISMLSSLMNVIPKVVLAGLQRGYEEYRCDYDNEEDVKEKTEKVIDLIDDYGFEDDSLDVMDLFSALVGELFNSGFLSPKSEKLEQAMTEQNATITPTDHLQPQN